MFKAMVLENHQAAVLRRCNPPSASNCIAWTLGNNNQEKLGTTIEACGIFLAVKHMQPAALSIMDGGSLWEAETCSSQPDATGLQTAINAWGLRRLFGSKGKGHNGWRGAGPTAPAISKRLGYHHCKRQQTTAAGSRRCSVNNTQPATASSHRMAAAPSARPDRGAAGNRWQPLCQGGPRVASMPVKPAWCT
jgi:hypothetical protein